LRQLPRRRARKPSGELPAPPHDATGHTWHHPDQQLFAITKHGMARFAPADYKSAMPAFVGTLSDRDIRAVIAYIKSTWPEDIRRRQPKRD
jgi:mono/diheme cytochrome c family protein